MDNYIVKNIEEVTLRMKNEMAEMEAQLKRKVSFSEYATVALEYVREKAKKTGVITPKDQHLLGAILGSMLHEAYCDSRKLDKPNENGLPNNPREKKLTDEMDKKFAQDVLSGKVPQSATLYVKNGVVCMDIANTEFVNLSPYWQKDNFMAGKTAARTIITCWKGLTHNNEEVQKFVTVAVANAIHESWISRGNVYYDEYQGEVFTNAELDTAYIFLEDIEKQKDLEHLIMAKKVVGEIVESISKTKNNQSENTDKQPGDE